MPRFSAWRAAAGLLPLLFVACRPTPEPDAAGVTSHLSGTITAPDSLAGPYEVFVLNETQGATDTLGYAMADPQGRFSLRVEAPDRGIYPLVIARQQRPLRIDELAVADGDTARLAVTLPLRGRSLRVRSRENDAWTGYRNARLQYGRSVQAALTSGDSTRAGLRGAALQTSAVMWSLRETYAGTVAAEVGAAESISLLSGWDDATALARAETIAPAEAGYADVAEAARRAEARQKGLAAAAALLERYRDRAATPASAARIQASLVTLYLDSLKGPSAIAAIERLAADHKNTPWVEWAARARYEAEHLLPGMGAPAIAARTVAGEAVRMADLKGKTVLVEFFRPSEDTRQALASREVLLAPLTQAGLEVVSAAVLADTLVSRAFFSQYRPLGRQVVAGGPQDPLARAFNVQVLPTYYLIGPDGTIRAKYTGATLLSATEDARRLMGLPTLGR